MHSPGGEDIGFQAFRYQDAALQVHTYKYVRVVPR